MTVAEIGGAVVSDRGCNGSRNSGCNGGGNSGCNAVAETVEAAAAAETLALTTLALVVTETGKVGVGGGRGVEDRSGDSDNGDDGSRS